MSRHASVNRMDHRSPFARTNQPKAAGGAHGSKGRLNTVASEEIEAWQGPGGLPDHEEVRTLPTRPDEGQAGEEERS